MKNIVFDMKPSTKQKEFLLSKAKYTAYGGARGGGKSWALRYKLLLLCLRYAGIRTVIIRRTFPELRENHVYALYELAVKTGLAEYSETHKVFKFINGSVIKLGYLDSESDLLQYKGRNLILLLWTKQRRYTSALLPCWRLPCAVRTASQRECTLLVTRAVWGTDG